MTGLFSYSTPEQLFEKLIKDFSAFYQAPSVDGLYAVLFPLYHLREWIYPGKYTSYANKPVVNRTGEELLHETLFNMREYQIVRDLCNNAKHFADDDSNLSNRTAELESLRFGYGRYGDSFGITHYLVDGVEIRDILWPVYMTYFEYFKGSKKNDSSDISHQH